MKTFDFILRFDGRDRHLTAKDGLSIKDLSSLLSSLYGALNIGDRDKLVLSEVRGNCYAINLTTNNEVVHETLKVVHRKISENDFDGLNQKQLKYADTMKSILKDNLYLQAYDEMKDFKVEVDEIKIPELPPFYYEISTVYGIVTSIGGRSIDATSYIKINGQPYDIKVTRSQEKNLIPFFKKNRIAFVLNKKISTEDNLIKGAELVSFEVTQEQSFLESINQVRDDDFDDQIYELFKNHNQLE